MRFLVYDTVIGVLVCASVGKASRCLKAWHCQEVCLLNLFRVIVLLKLRVVLLVLFEDVFRIQGLVFLGLCHVVSLPVSLGWGQ